MEYTLYIIASILILPSLIYGIYCSQKVNKTFNIYKTEYASSGKTAAKVARELLDVAGLQNVEIKKIRGELTDNYDPTKKVLNLSESTYDSTSVAAIGIAAHEVGHAYQHKEKYLPLVIRSIFVPIVNFGSKLFLPIFIIGIILSALTYSSIGYTIIWIAVALYGLSTLFCFITLPVEFNASKRAIKNLETFGILNGDEMIGAKEVLIAAAQTYIASFLTSLLYFLRFLARILIMFGDRRK